MPSNRSSAENDFLDRLDEMRTHTGLSRPQWMRILRVNTEAEILSDAGDVGYRATRALDEYNKFVEDVCDDVDNEAKRPAFVLEGVGYLSTLQVAHALGIGDFHVANLKRRSKLPFIQIGVRSVGYDPADVKALIRQETPAQSPLAGAFIRYLAAHDPEAFEGVSTTDIILTEEPEAEVAAVA